MTTATHDLAQFAASLTPEKIPAGVFARITDLYVDWAGSAFSGKGHQAISIIESFARSMGPESGPSEILTSGGSTSPFFASLVNGAASHISEQDDVHNGSVFHPAAIVFPACLAMAQKLGVSGTKFLTACIAGYEVGIRVGEFLGRSHYEVFHTTGTAGTFASAAAVGNLIGLDEEQMLHAFGSAGTQSAGLWEFLKDAAHSKQLHTAKSSAEGLMAALIAAEGFTGAKDILAGEKGLAAGTSTDADISKLNDDLGERWCVMETSFKFHASCRHSHPAADALLKAMQENQLTSNAIDTVQCFVHKGAIDVLGPVKTPKTVHQAKFSMGATLGLIATHGKAGLVEFDNLFDDENALAFMDKVFMTLDSDVDRAYPKQWIGKVNVRTHRGEEYQALVDTPKGDPGNLLTRDEIDRKARSLAVSGGAIREKNLDALMHRLWDVKNQNAMSSLLKF